MDLSDPGEEELEEDDGDWSFEPDPLASPLFGDHEVRRSFFLFLPLFSPKSDVLMLVLVVAGILPDPTQCLFAVTLSIAQC